LILSPFLIKRKNSNRKGIVFFVVIGAIVVLAVLVASYNYLVMGKSNESREILRHLRAEKCAQSVCRFVFSHFISDLNDETSGGGIRIREALISSNSSDKLSEELSKKWLAHIGFDNLIDNLLKGTTGNEKPEVPLIEIGFSDIASLNSLKSSKGIGDEVTFFDWEKVGRLTVRVTIKIGKSRAVWQETRPFKVVFPFPIPITKFNFYWTDGADDSFAFNTVSIKSGSGDSANGKHPFLLDNKKSTGDEDNKTGDMWMKRGWIYIGGDHLILNRASGSEKYGQNFYSYRDSGLPVTLMLDFPSGDRWDTNLYNNELLGFRVAYWGFSDSLTGSSNQTWKMILKSEFDNNPPGSSQTDKFWNSSCLHLFSDVGVRGSSSESNNIVPSITRVIGKVDDRYLEMGYLLPVNSSESLFAAIIGIGDGKDKTEYESLKKNYSSENGNKYSFENFLFFSEGYDFENDSGNKGADVLQKYFEKLDYSVSDVSAVDYYKVMSKSNIRSIDVTYNIISEYSKNNDEVSLPPDPSVPDVNNTVFKPKDFVGDELKLGYLPKNIENLDVSEIGKSEDRTLGLSLRTCYEITGSSDGIQSLLNSYFGSNSNGSDLNLNNLVYKVTSDSENVRFRNMNINTPGTIYSDGPISVGAFLPPQGDSAKTPVMLLAGKGPITVNNSGNSEVRAYLVALGEGGTVKADRKDVPLLINGGMAVKEFKPENIPDKGGYLVYNSELDPTEEDFIPKYLGVAVGPKGCNP
jgi:hypothetical protein